MSDEVKQPNELSRPLFPHQLTSISNMETLERNGCVRCSTYVKETRLGVLADISGYGKTLSCVALVLRDKMQWDKNESYTHKTVSSEAAGLVITIQEDYFEKLNATLVLCSPTILAQWREELAFTQLRTTEIVSKREIRDLRVNNWDVVLVIPSMFNELVGMFHRLAWKRFIFDEPGHVRVASMRRVVAGFTWFVTANPNNISKSHATCRSSFMKEIVEAGSFDIVRMRELIIKNSDDYVRSSYMLPLPIHRYHKCKLPLASVTKGLVSANVTSLIESGDIRGALASFGARSTSNFIDSLKIEKERERLAIISMKEEFSDDNDTQKVRDCDIKLQKINDDLAVLECRIENWAGTSCSICMGLLDHPMLETRCHNMFCAGCIIKWLSENKTCPLCRYDITKKDLIEVDTGDICLNERDMKSQKGIQMTKHDTAMQIIKSDPDGRFVIYSCHDASFDPCFKILDDQSTSYRVVKGNASAREDSLQEFQMGNTNILFLNALKDAAGINLQTATDIILFHEMSDSLESQIIGRALRIGRDPCNVLTVHHLVHAEV